MKPLPPVTSDARRQNLMAAGMRSDARPNLVRVALQRCAVATMTNGRWHELAELISEQAAAWVTNHTRFLRSLHFDDEDYGGHVLEFFRRFLGVGFGNVPVCVEFLGLSAWLEENEPELHARLYEGASVAAPAAEDLANLSDGSAIRENLARLQRGLDGGDAPATIGTAKDLIESTAKLVLTADGQTITKTEDLPSLIKRTHQVVNLHAASAAHTNPEVQAAVKQIRGGLQSVALGVVKLRNTAGTGHGHVLASPSGLADDARLAAEAAAAWIRSVLAAYSKFTSRTI